MPEPPGALGARVDVPVVIAGGVPDGAPVDVPEVVDVPELLDVLDGPLSLSDPHAASIGAAARAALKPPTADHRRSAAQVPVPRSALSSQ